MDRMKRIFILLFILNNLSLADWKKPQVWFGIENQDIHTPIRLAGGLVASFQSDETPVMIMKQLLQERGLAKHYTQQQWSVEVEQLISPQFSASIKGYFGNNNQSIYPFYLEDRSAMLELIAKYRDSNTAHGLGFGLRKHHSFVQTHPFVEGTLSASVFVPSIRFSSEIKLSDHVKAGIGASASTLLSPQNNIKQSGLLSSKSILNVYDPEKTGLMVDYATYASLAYSLNI